MDLYAKLNQNMEEITDMFSKGIKEHETKLHLALSSAEPTVTSLAQEFSSFKIFMLESLNKLKTQIQLLTLGLDRHETYSRRKILLFHGVTETKSEHIQEVMKSILLNKLKLSSDTVSNIHHCHRIGQSNAKNDRPILIKFNSFIIRKLVWDSKTALKGSGITISEFLTKARHQVFSEARIYFGMNNVWSAEGKISIILPDKSRKKIESLPELSILMKKFPASTPNPKLSGFSKSSDGKVQISSAQAHSSSPGIKGISAESEVDNSSSEAQEDGHTLNAQLDKRNRRAKRIAVKS